ncbi:TonB-dependent receptor [Sphingobacterium oryzagri]|uniref:TonB-dependent receptor n=1 Tax=Sphingobacterium oryzagri TaxID=3025669 RepID=A0ABY7WGR6_9SPHI|nr:TonB-dependent receptor [Sphingobacterium sp. KACC 22765]WDF68827.1 TonB-dependent receptor [Sphingobacterium sp. KACC 22765]
MIKHLSYYLFALLFLSGFTISFAQSTRQGTVVEAATGKPISDATITVKGTTVQTNTNANGRFTLTNIANGSTLTVSSIGYRSIEIPASDDLSAIKLTQAAQDLDEVVVIAYGTAKKSDFTGSVSTISCEQLQRAQVSSVSKALQGLAAGLQSVSSSGQPGTDATIRIRGIGSINASSDPLYVVDGVPYGGSISAINPVDIESISVLKDATASALYGSRAANGVIMITTKQGRPGVKPAIDARFTQGYSSRAVKDYEHLSTDQHFELYWRSIYNQLSTTNDPETAARLASGRVVQELGINPYGANFPQPVGLDGKIVSGATPLWNDNWQNELEQLAPRTEATLNISGGGENNRYYLSGNYLNDRGIGIGSGNRRYNVRSNTTVDATPWLEVGLNVSATASKQDYPQSEDSQVSNIINFGRRLPSFYPVYARNPDGSLVTDANGERVVDFGSYRPSAANPNWNLLGTYDLDLRETLRDEVTTRVFANVKISKNLSLRSSYNIDYRNQTAHNYTNPLLGGSANINGSVSKSNTRNVSWTQNNILTYEKDFEGGHHLNVLAGQELFNYNSSTFNGSRQNFVLPYLYEPAAASQLNSFTGSSNDHRILSFLGRVEYDYLKRYIFSGSLRTDGTSRFSPEQRWGNFWSIGGAWKLAEEKFLRDASWINLLNIKGSYGGQGNDNIGTYYAYEALYAIANNLGEGGVSPSRLPTPNLKWETNLNLNVGVDFGLFNNRLAGTLEFFDRRSKDLLFSRPLPPSSGFSAIDENVGSLKNTGFELDLRVAAISNANFRWDVAFNIAHFRNQVTSLPQKAIISGTKRLEVGRSVYDFWLRDWAGVDPANGNPLWYQDVTEPDANGVPQVVGKTTTSNYSSATFYYTGSSLPDVYGGLTNTFGYKGFELSFLFSYSIGGKVLDGDVPALYHNGTAGVAWHRDMAASWTPENTDTDIPRLGGASAQAASQSTRFLYDASYLRLRNLSLSYTIPTSFANKLGLGRLSANILGENLLTFFGHQGMDPEQSVGGTTYFRYPAMRVISGGINIGF